MQFVDEVKIDVVAGRGGDGAVAWRREMYVPRGGPAGGDGGNGGSVIFEADERLYSLLDFRFRPNWIAKDGEKGRSKMQNGAAGEDLIVRVPVGTQVIDLETEELLADLTQKGQTALLCKGGSGGWGNVHFKTSTRQAPEFAKAGLDGEKRTIQLKLKLLADVGLVGYPNAGKSTLLSRISAAKPKIANYPFTTLNPQLGVVQVEGGKSFVVADVPGLIEGASEGQGLGIQFLKHLERTRALCHLIEPEVLDPDAPEDFLVQKYEAIRHELENFSSDFLKLPEIVAVTKADLYGDVPDSPVRKQILALEAHLAGKQIAIKKISAHTGNGIRELIFTLWDVVEDPIQEPDKEIEADLDFEDPRGPILED